MVRSVIAKVRAELLRLKKIHMDWFSSQISATQTDPVSANRSFTPVS